MSTAGKCNKCIFCDRNGSISLRSSDFHPQRHVCQDCLFPNYFGWKHIKLPLGDPHSPVITGQGEKYVRIFADHSNIWIEAMTRAAKRLNLKTAQDPRVRIDYERLRDFVSRERGKVIQATMYGSVPPPVDTFWKKVQEDKWDVKTFDRSATTGKEKEVDSQIIADVTEVACTTPVHLRGTIIILSGDRDMAPAVEKALMYGSQVLMYMWENSHSLRHQLDVYKQKYPGKISYVYLDKLEKDIIFFNRELPEHPQSYYKNHAAVINLKDGYNMDKDIIKNRGWWAKIERASKWPVQFRFVEGNDKQLLLIFHTEKETMEEEDLKELVSFIIRSKQFSCVEKCEIYCGAKCVKDSEGFIRHEKIKVQKPRSPKDAAWAPQSTQEKWSISKSAEAEKSTIPSQIPSLEPSLPQPKKKIKATKKSEPKCCLRRNCEDGLGCFYQHSDDDQKLFSRGRNGGKGRPDRKTVKCKDFPKCRFPTVECDYAHEKADRWCDWCHQSGHFSSECKDTPCSHPRHSKQPTLGDFMNV